MVIYRWLADAVVVLHFTYVTVVIGGLLVVPVGALFRWRWVRNFWFRAIHLLMITIVVVESLLDIECPYTTSEAINRLAAGETVHQGTFIGRWAHELLFYDPPDYRVFTVAYCVFGALVVLALVLVPPKWPRRRGLAHKGDQTAAK
jgi:hypothetical protein